MGGSMKQLDAATTKLMDDCEKKIIQAAQPRCLYKYFDIAFTDNGVALSGTDLVLKGNDILNHLSGCFGVVLMAATLSGGIDSLLRTLQITDMAAAVVANAMASTAIEQVCDSADKLIDRQFNNSYKTFRFSPGYGDFPIEIQRDFLNLLDAPKKIGLCPAGESCLLTPVKSVTAVVGLSKNPIERKKRGCASCNLNGKCQYRKAGNRCV